jgi:protein-tyrosine phosphatase
MPEPTPEGAGHALGIASVPNLRDVGGYRTSDGRLVRTSLVYRSSQLSGIGPDDLERLAALGLERDIDLRTAEEAAAVPDELPPGVQRVWLSVFPDGKPEGTASLDMLLGNPAEANARVGNGRMDRLLVRAYRGFVSLPSAKQAYGRLLASLAEPGGLPALFHCTAGKDRTGWAAAALLTLLGVPRETVMADYLRSNDYVIPHYAQVIDRFVAAGGDPGIVAALFGVKPEYLEAAFDEVEGQHGTIEEYFAEALGIDADGQRALRAVLLEA